MPVPELQIIKELIQTGVVGLMLGLALLMLWRKDKALSASEQARIDDAKEQVKVNAATTREIISAVAALTKIAESTEKKDAQLAYLKAELAQQRADYELLERQLNAPPPPVRERMATGPHTPVTLPIVGPPRHRGE